jgi:hypothetical protein
MEYGGGLGKSFTVPQSKVLSGMLYSSLRERAGERTLA